MSELTAEQEKAWDHRVSISHERVEHYDNDPQMQIVLQDDRAILAIDKERTSLRAEVEEANDRLAQVADQCAESLALNIKLEEAVEWVRPLLTTDDQRKELRRRAGKEG